ncbi:MAG: LON peptidase substrate-binding domain-containing protein [Candidatus Acidiferrum sp.]
MRPERIPLFPLNVVLLPGADLPLHIFEPRYRGMVRDCLSAKSFFGMVLTIDDGVAGVGCTAEIIEVVQRYEDGRLDILTVGREVFRVTELTTKEPLLQAQVEFLEDEEDTIDAAAQRKLIELYEVCHTIVFEDLPKELAVNARVPLSYAIAAALPLELLWKQQILELRSESERQARLTAYLRDWAPHLQKSKAARQRAGSNGHGLN